MGIALYEYMCVLFPLVLIPLGFDIVQYFADLTHLRLKCNCDSNADFFLLDNAPWFTC